MDTTLVFNILVVDEPTGIKEQTTNANFMTVFPNPATDNMNVGYVLTKTGTVDLKIINITGQQVKAVYTGTQPAGNFTMNTNTADLAPGIYSYILTVDGMVSRKMFVKN
ncbi:MAG: T9SS type A sorting domain-containing protein [Sphingobacteriales bacterium JAD_PAG50586_3]|nr:MAG: T9SS type A sorting domain-containing protein [Sphingobacteriales bacterium JAD_PAG50586_3]